TRACPGSSSPTAARWIANEDRYRYCDNRAAKITALGQIAPGSDSIQWTIPTTLDLQLSRGRFHLYDSNGHTSDSFLIRPRPRHYPRAVDPYFLLIVYFSLHTIHPPFSHF
ncbi:hypothetical protein BX616_003907, partial [Lobosporangium transversale]